MDFLGVVDKTFLITGVANKKSVATFTAKTLIDAGAKIILSVQTEDMVPKVQNIFPDSKIYICNVESQDSITQLGNNIKADGVSLSGYLHSIAFANFAEGVKPFIETNMVDFLQAANISMLSMTTLANAIRDSLEQDASIVTVSISSTRATSYGLLGPIKAALDASVGYLAKSFSEFSKVRVNAVCAGPLKTSASAGIPGYINNYLYAEKLTLRKEAIKTQEVADSICFLLSHRSSGINGEKIVVDAGINSNYFDQDIVNKVME
ncbi:MAG: SDR family oxidoreductase [Bacteriovoracaceae bacterium]|nr:SDR family oxidoreductase [Bacteriovoracaceae bacterium]